MSKLWEAEKKARIEKRPEGITGTLENWTYDYDNHVYWGNVYGDIRERFADGHWIHTSLVDKVEDDLVYTLNSTYKLGKPHEEKPLE